jgi:predicted double-glycine peptidase
MRIALLFTVIVTAAFLPQAASANDFGLVAGNSAFSLDVKSFKQQRFKEVIAQQYDYSCGSAALATLLKYHYKTPVTEQSVLDAMYQVGDQKKIKSQGFSLLDMKQYLHHRGLMADGFQVDVEKIRQAGIPGIVLINTNGYMHFVVVKGVNDSHVLIGDPALGLRKMPRHQFEKIWNNVFFVIRNNVAGAKLSFVNDDKWEERRKELFSNALSSDKLSTFTVHTQVSPNIFY